MNMVMNLNLYRPQDLGSLGRGGYVYSLRVGGTYTYILKSEKDFMPIYERERPFILKE
jgi:hypothetical protein